MIPAEKAKEIVDDKQQMRIIYIIQQEVEDYLKEQKIKEAIKKM